jgi:ribosomal protein L11 methyltransferase
MAYLKLFVIATNNLAENIAEAFENCGALSVSFEDAEDNPVYQINLNETPLWDSTKISALFAEDSDAGSIITKMNQQFKNLVFNSEILADQDWVRLTQQQFPPMFFGDKLCVCPSFHSVENFSGVIVKIDPGLAFGTGTHPTTSLCLQWLTENEIKNKIVVDYGCGSGILALAALALGAKKVYATDHDPQAILATENNSKLNSFAHKDNLVIVTSNKMPKIKADIVIANILAKPLISLSETISDLVKANGDLILSGLLVSETETVFNAYPKHFTMKHSTHLDEWVRLDLINNISSATV